MDKQTLLQKVVETLTKEEVFLKESLKTTRQAANDAPGAMQSHSDTTKWQMGQRIGAIEKALVDTQQGLANLKRLVVSPPTTTRCAVYALVEALNLEDNSSGRYFLLPAGGGNTYEVDAREVTILNMSAPMARAFIGAEGGDEVEIKIQNTKKTLRIISVT